MQQIEQMGQVLARLLSKLHGIRNKGKAGLSIEEIRQTYMDELDLPLELIMNAPTGAIIEMLTGRVKYLDSHLDKMGDILRETAGLCEISGDGKSARNLYEKSLVIFEYLQSSSNSFSMERMIKIDELRENLD